MAMDCSSRGTGWPLSSTRASSCPPRQSTFIQWTPPPLRTISHLPISSRSYALCHRLPMGTPTSVQHSAASSHRRHTIAPLTCLSPTATAVVAPCPSPYTPALSLPSGATSCAPVPSGILGTLAWYPLVWRSLSSATTIPSPLPSSLACPLPRFPSLPCVPITSESGAFPHLLYQCLFYPWPRLDVLQTCFLTQRLVSNSIYNVVY